MSGSMMGKPAAIGVVLAMVCGGPAAADGSPTDQSVEQLKWEMEELQRQLKAIEREQAEQKAQIENEVVRSAEEPGKYRLPGSPTTFEIGGYVKADFIYDVDEDLGDLFIQENISTTDEGDESHFGAHSRQSRLFFKTSTPTDYGPVKTHIEADFFGGGGNEAFSNSFRFRLRHAYADIGNVRVGQNWTLFMPIQFYPRTLDFQGPAGIPFVRQTQLRYTHSVNQNLTVAASIENSEFSGRDNDGDDIGESTGSPALADPSLSVDKLPDFVGAVTYSNSWGMAKIAGVLRHLEVPGAGDETAWGVNASAKAKLWRGGAVVGTVTYGDGVGRYIINGFGRDAFINDAGDIETLSALGFAAGIEQQLTSTVKAHAYYGYYEVDDTLFETDLETLQSAHLNVIWSPTKKWNVGGELIYGEREDVNGDRDDNLRLQGSVQVNF